MNIKIEFESETKNFFKEDDWYKFSYNTYSLYMRYVGKSRIDGLNIFETVTPSKGIIVDYSYNGVEIKEVHLISALEDHLPLFAGVPTKKQQLTEFIMSELGLTDRDLIGSGALKKVVRDIRLSKILNK